MGELAKPGCKETKRKRNQKKPVYALFFYADLAEKNKQKKEEEPLGWRAEKKGEGGKNTFFPYQLKQIAATKEKRTRQMVHHPKVKTSEEEKVENKKKKKNANCTTHTRKGGDKT